MERLKTGKNLGFLTDDITRDCCKYQVAIMEKDLQRLDQGKIVEKDQQRFANHKAYLKHHVNNEVLKPYLKNTIVTERLSAIYKHEEHQQILQKQQAIELKQEKALEKEYGKSRFGL